MSKLPTVSKGKELPEENIVQTEVPVESELNQTQPDETPKLEIVPQESRKIEEIPEGSPPKEEMPSDFIEENCVVIGGKKIEIKPTKLKYFRNKAASAYGVIKAVPIHELLTYGKGAFDETRSADQLLYDFLVSVFDDPAFVRVNYDELDADVIEKIIKIFGRINHIDEKEEAIRKNREAQEQARAKH